MHPDLHLVERMRQGEQAAFDQFFYAYASHLAGFIGRRTSFEGSALEDAVQVTLINAIRAIGNFRGESNLFTWICQICRNHLADLARKAKRQPKSHSLETVLENGDGHGALVLADTRDPLHECTADSSRDAVRRVINLLPASYAQVLELRFGSDLAVTEIARELGISESAAESRLSRARHAFRERWNELSMVSVAA